MRVVSLLLVLVGSGLAQGNDGDVKKYSATLIDAINKIDYTNAKDAAEKIGAANSVFAVQSLFEAVQQSEGMIKSLRAAQNGYNAEIQRHQTWRIKKTPQGDFVDPADTETYMKWREAMTKSQENETKIVNSSSIEDAIINAIGKCRDEKAAGAAIQRLNGGTAELRAAAARAAGINGSGAAVDALWAACDKEKEANVLIVIIEGLIKGGTKGPDYDKRMSVHLKSDMHPVRDAAVRWFNQNCSLEGVGYLVEALEKAQGKFKYDLLAAIRKTTGINKGDDYSAWKGWWEANKDEFTKGTYKPKGGELEGQEGGTGAFFGIPIKSKNVIFILDRSGSMVAPVKVPKIVDTGGNSAPGNLKLPDKPRRVDLARYELKKALYKMEEGTKFNILFYNHGFVEWAGGMKKLDKGTRASAASFIDSVDPEGQTNPYDPLEKAFTYAADLNERVKKEGVDTIFLLTDGLPNAGQISEPAKIIDKIKIMNRTRKVTINCILVMDSGDGEYSEGAAFMKGLAEATGGEFVDVCK